MIKQILISFFFENSIMSVLNLGVRTSSYGLNARSSNCSKLIANRLKTMTTQVIVIIFFDDMGYFSSDNSVLVDTVADDAERFPFENRWTISIFI